MTTDQDPTGVMSRRQLLVRGAVGAAAVGAAAASIPAVEALASPSNGTRVAKSAQRPKMAGSGSIAWVVPCIAAWNLQLDVGFHDATALTGWKLRKIGVPCAQNTTVNNVRILQQALQLRPKVVATPMYLAAIEPVVKSLIRAGVQVVLVNGQIPRIKKALNLPYVGQDEIQAGIANGLHLAGLLARIGRKTGTIIAGNSSPGGIVPLQRVAGARQGVKQFNKQHGTSFTVEMFIDQSLISPAAALIAYKTKMEQLGSRFVGILDIAGDSGAGPVIQALKELGHKPGRYPMVAWDTGPNVTAGIRDGWINQTLDQELYLEGFWPALIAWGMAERQFPSQDVHTGLDVINRANLGAAQARDAKMAKLAKEYGITF